MLRRLAWSLLAGSVSSFGYGITNLSKDHLLVGGDAGLVFPPWAVPAGAAFGVVAAVLFLWVLSARRRTGKVPWALVMVAVACLASIGVFWFSLGQTPQDLCPDGVLTADGCLVG